MTKDILKIKDGDVVFCSRCGDLIEVAGIEDNRKEFAFLFPEGNLKEADIICNECFDTILEFKTKNN